MLCDECSQTARIEGKEYCAACLEKTKECKRCYAELSIFEFEKNQRTPKGARNRRSECRRCRKNRVGKPLSIAKKKAFELQHPRPVIGDIFQCPVCVRIFTITTSQSVNLDHDKDTGEPRGWLCGDCNTSIGRLHDDISVLARAILWLKDMGKGIKSITF